MFYQRLKSGSMLSQMHLKITVLDDKQMKRCNEDLTLEATSDQLVANALMVNNNGTCRACSSPTDAIDLIDFRSSNQPKVRLKDEDTSWDYIHNRFNSGVSTCAISMTKCVKRAEQHQ